MTMVSNNRTGSGQFSTAHAFLPSSVSGSLALLTDSGRWVGDTTSTFLADFARAMMKNRPALPLGSVTSLPDIWGQAVCYYAAFTNQTHVLHDPVIDEWRGMLATIGLAGLRDLPVRVVPVDLKKLSLNPEWDGRSTVSNWDKANQPNLGRVLVDNLPGFVDRPNDRFRTNALVFLWRKPDGSEEPLAFCFDYFLVIPARYYDGLLDPKQVPWGNWTAGKGYPLHDPSGDENALDGWQRGALAAWLDRLGQGVLEAGAGALRVQNGYRASLVAALNAFRGDIVKRGVTTTSGFTFRNGFGDLPVGFDIAFPNLLQVPHPQGGGGADGMGSSGRPGSPPASAAAQARTTPGQPDIIAALVANGEPITDLHVPPRPSLAATGYKGGILLAIELSGRIDNAPLLVDAVRVDEAIEHLRGGRVDYIEDYRVRLRAQGLSLLTADDLFQPRLASFGGATVKTHREGWGQYLYPLKPQVLALFEPWDLASRLHLRYDGNGRATVGLVIDLPGPDGAKAAVEVKKVYERRDIVNVTPPGRLEVWPDFVSSQWRHHYLDVWTTRERALTVAAALAPGRLAKLLPPDPERALDALRAWPGEGPERTPLHRNDPSLPDQRRTFLCDRPIEAVILSGIAPSGQSVEGLCMVFSSQPDVRNPNTPLTYRVAVDFGSASTTVMVRASGNTESRRLEFKAAPIAVIDQEFQVRRGDEFQTDAQEQPFVTALGMYGDVAQRADAHPRETAFLPLPGAYSPLMTLQCGDGGSQGLVNTGSDIHIVYGLKGRPRNAFREADRVNAWNWVGLLLGETCLLAAASLCRDRADLSSIDWRVSYPGTYLPHERDILEDLFRNAVKRLYRSPNDKADETGAPDMGGCMEMEAISAGRYFQMLNGTSFGGLSITADIGGHSTDVCIWKQNEPVWAASLNIAAQDLFTDYFVYRPDNLSGVIDSALFPRFKAAIGRKEDTEEKRGLVELALHGKKLGDILRPQGQERLEAASKVFYYGLLHYLGQVLRSLPEVMPADVSRTNLTLLLGGRGAQILQATIGDRMLGTVLRRYLNPAGPTNWLPGGANWLRADVRIAPSLNAKEEVARGLLMGNRLGEGEALTVRSPLPLGADVACGAADCRPGSYLTIDQISGPVPAIIRQDQFTDFLVTIRDVVGGLVKLPNGDELLNDVSGDFEQECRRGRDYIADLRRLNGEANGIIQIQPPFILALKRTVAAIVGR